MLFGFVPVFRFIVSILFYSGLMCISHVFESLFCVHLLKTPHLLAAAALHFAPQVTTQTSKTLIGNGTQLDQQ